jgi:hypothetical protein
MPKEIIDKFEKQYPGRGKEVYYATMNKHNRNPETGKPIAHKKEETMPKDTSILSETDILTESQKSELKNIIDSLVEERTKEKNAQFIQQYTEFIVEQATKRITSGLMSKMQTKINEEISLIKEKANKVCRSVVCEASNKIATEKSKNKKLMEEFKATAPVIIEEMAAQKAEELAEDALAALKQNEKLVESLQNIVKGLESAGFVINEDVDGRMKKTMNENLELKTKVIKTERDLKLAQLSEGMLPVQKREVAELLSECTTAAMIEERFGLIRNKVMKQEAIIEEEKTPEPKKEMINEEDAFSGLLSMSKKYIQKR